jgi:hypothetical protein
MDAITRLSEDFVSRHHISPESYRVGLVAAISLLDKLDLVSLAILIVQQEARSQ